MSKDIHKTAIVSSKAEIDEDVYIGPFCIIGEEVVIRRGTKLISNVIVEGDTEIGKDCVIHPFATIGVAPQDLKYKNEETGVKIGNKNIIREYVSIHRASVGGDGFTEIGDSNFLMAYVHIAHDCKIGNSVIMANAATLAGHVHVEDYAVIGGLVAVHQFTRIGAYAMVGGFSGIGQDIPPYTMASGARAKLYGLNAIGLKRHGFSDEAINSLKKAYKILFREKRTLKDALKKIKSDLPETPEIKHLIEFIEKNKRGICR
ncbi:acyl-[acyl-carrier-protein]--UDP-N-acetylglucosam ine O-acyltransferase [Dissulfurispira thermophila]|uniref:Acyl-[acyl-carrier-protein]--UDP-N-acetylglucosamine O-acyltransferase n=2 Tax=root TaxID=1 RepID=A0A7G1GXT7_9BACT|nr:acyl-ACP--UDP-N-acetylglucosamine O-acyltransferase [Dissulfurispira thermophila]BCB95150.1 acyl-[acyl-carrier-protein]--UDP-N-acetylglucosam ine O-acyltransferase [Dissulfurispira thermophila]